MGSSLSCAATARAALDLRGDAADRRDEEQQASDRRGAVGSALLIIDNRELLDELAEALLANETLDRAEIERDHGSRSAATRTSPKRRGARPIGADRGDAEASASTAAALRRRRADTADGPGTQRGAAAPTARAPPPRRRAPSPPRPASARLAAYRRRLPSPMFDAVDHIGVAVEDLDAAIELYSERARDAAEHRETVDRAGRRGRAAGRRRLARRAARAARRRDAGRQVPGQARARASPHRLPLRRTSRGARALPRSAGCA